MPLLEVRDLRVGFQAGGRVLNAVDGVDLRLEPGETLGIVGESGSGKSTLALALMRLIPSSDRPQLSGQVLWDGRDLLQMQDEQVRRLRGGEISMVLQDPSAALNPVLTIGDQVAEAIAAHTPCPSRELRGRVVEALARFGIADPEARIHDYPHQLSGGMRQRVVGAIAVAAPPRLLIADEPTTSLDVTVQAQYLDLLQQLQRQLRMAMLLITHDFGVVAKMCDRVAVMYAGQIVESAEVRRIFRSPAHWYTAALLDSMPKRSGEQQRLRSIRGAPLRLGSTPDIAGCRFAPRCENAQARCLSELPPRTGLDAQHELRCWYPVTHALRAERGASEVAEP